MNPCRIAALVGFLAVIVASPSAKAITFGTLDTVHTYAGAIVIHRLDGDFGLFCSGSLVSARVFLTAGHCTNMLAQSGVPPERLFVSFALRPLEEPGSWNAVASFSTHPDFRQHIVNAGMVDSHDVGVLVLAKPVKNIILGTLAPVSFLDSLDSAGKLQVHETLFTSVGYGEDQNFQPTLERRMTVSGFQSLLEAFLQLNQNNALSFGGTCSGDSGGPSIYSDGTNEFIVALTSWGDARCVSTNTVYRIDTISAMSFIQQAISANP